MIHIVNVIIFKKKRKKKHFIKHFLKQSHTKRKTSTPKLSSQIVPYNLSHNSSIEKKKKKTQTQGAKLKKKSQN